MEAVTQALLLVLAGLSVVEAGNLFEKDSPFYYDWESLQLGGMIFGGLLCVAGIALVLSNKCKCQQSEGPSPPTEKATPLLKGGASAS